MIFTDGTTPVDHPTNGGTNTVGTAGQDAGAFLTAQLGNNKSFCYEPGTYTFTSTVTISQVAVSMLCSSIGENAAGTSGTILRRSGNGDLFDVTGAQFYMNGCQLDTSATQASGIGLSVTGYNARVQNTNIGNVVNGQQYFFTCISAAGQYGFYMNMLLNNCVSSAITVTGGTNDNRFEHIVVANWGSNIFTTNPAGITLTNTLGTFFTDITVSQCDPGMLINPGNGQVVTETFFQDVNIDTNWGMSISTKPTGTGLIKQLHFTNLWANSDLKKASPTDNPSVLLQSVNATTWEGGEIAGNQWEGLIVNGTSTDFDFHGVQIRDNNQGNHLGVDGFFGGSPTPNMFINGASLRFRMIGGSLDNPAIGGNAGKAGGVYINTCQNCYIEAASFLTGAGVAMANPFGCNTCTNILLWQNFGYNPQPVRSQTAGASVWTYTNNDVYEEQLVLTAVNGISAMTCRGIVQSILVGIPTVLLFPGQTCAVTWMTTAPVFEIMPI